MGKAAEQHIAKDNGYLKGIIDPVALFRAEVPFSGMIGQAEDGEL